MSPLARLNRLFSADGRCIAIALDHALFNEVHLLNGVERMDDLVSKVAGSGVDAILLSPGQAFRLQKLRMSYKPSLILRADVSNVYSTPIPSYGFSQLLGDPVEQAIALDAAAVLLNLFHIEEDPLVYHHCVENISRLKPGCERFGIPLILEPLILERHDAAGGYSICGDLDRVCAMTRHAVELGADVVKADPSDTVEHYERVVEIAGGVPLLPRGGGKVDSIEILKRTHRLIEAGASGVVYGRNVFQHENLKGMIRALRAIVHEGGTVDSAQQHI